MSRPDERPSKVARAAEDLLARARREPTLDKELEELLYSISVARVEQFLTERGRQRQALIEFYCCGDTDLYWAVSGCLDEDDWLLLNDEEFEAEVRELVKTLGDTSVIFDPERSARLLEQLRAEWDKPRRGPLGRTRGGSPS